MDVRSFLLTLLDVSCKLKIMRGQFEETYPVLRGLSLFRLRVKLGGFGAKIESFIERGVHDPT